MSSIREIPKIQKLQEQLDELRSMEETFSALKTNGIEIPGFPNISSKILEYQHQLDNLISIHDQFNKIFQPLGWTLYERLNQEIIEEAITIARDTSLEMADDFLVNYFSPDWVRNHLVYLQHMKSFSPRLPLITKAVEDYEEKRYYSSIFVVLSTIDGWVNDLNIINNQRVGFFAESSELIAYDSMTAYSGGLVNLQKVFSKSRQKTHTETITIPFRNGIFHGTDLGFDNKTVAAKCWAALFVVREWAIKAERNELDPPPTKKPEPEVSLMEAIISYQKAITDGNKIKNWKPRSIIIGEDIPENGSPEEYPHNSPEHKLVEFLGLWMKNNYGGMSDCYSPMCPKSPKIINYEYRKMLLQSWKLKVTNDVSAFISDITVAAEVISSGKTTCKVIEYRLACSKKTDGSLAFIPNDETMWGITSHTIKK